MSAPDHDARAAGMPPSDWALPALTPTNEAWFTSGELALQACASCGVLQHPPEEICHACGSMAFTTEVVGAHGTVYSWVVVHHPVHRALEPAVPYAVVLVSLDEAPEVRVVGNLLDAPVDAVEIGMPVTATWDERVAEDGAVIRLPQWRRRDGGAGSATP